MHPTDILSREHRVIEARLDELEARLRGVEPGSVFPREFFEDALDFFRHFADGCHHAKEENFLFPLMKERGVPEHGGPIGVMLAEHDQGRRCLKTVRENLDAAARGSQTARDAVYASASEYADLLRRHISKEDNVLFRLAKMVLHPDDVAELQKQFAAVDVPQRFQAVAV